MPKVSFVVPCYKLAHLLPECIGSILAQTFQDYEIIILDDCSPDETPLVAGRFTDPRVRYVRHPRNLGHLRNYNSGIEISRGEYVWLISADDRLRRPYILERYLDLAERHPEIGFVFCPGMGLRANEETNLLGSCGDVDAVLPGRQFLHEKLLERNFILAASGMVRKRMYIEHGGFPLDLPYAGDWYLWCLFSLHGDVGYLAEPMVCYRDHDLSMTRILSADGVRRLLSDGFAVRWRIARAAERTGCDGLAAKACDLLVENYAHFLAGGDPGALRGDEETERGVEPVHLSPADVEQSVLRHADVASTGLRVLTRSLVLGGDLALQRGDRPLAASLYSAALRSKPSSLEALSKSVLLRLGSVGDVLRRHLARRRRRDGRAPAGHGMTYS